MIPSHTGPLRIADLASFDDEALRTFLDPEDGGIQPEELGIAMVNSPRGLKRRVHESLPANARALFEQAVSRTWSPSEVEKALRSVLDRLFWPMVYWNRIDEYEELIEGEELHPGILDSIDLDERVVCDIGAGTGRFALLAAPRAALIIAVDAVPQMLERLALHARGKNLLNIQIRRGRFAALPVADESVDLAVACSSFTNEGPHGGARSLAEAERIVKPGGQIVVVWPQEPDFLVQRGFRHVVLPGNDSRTFRDVASAEHLCRDFYCESAARWVRENGSAVVTYSVLGTHPPNDFCIRRA